MKNWICCLSLLFLVACDKVDDLPAWDPYMTLAQIESYGAVQGAVDEAALTAALSSSAFTGTVCNFHQDGAWMYHNAPLFGSTRNQFFLFDPAAGRCAEGVFDWLYTPKVISYGFSYDSGRKTIVLHAVDDPSDVIVEMAIVYFSVGRMILHEIFHNEVSDVDQVYLVGDFTSMTREDFRKKFSYAEK